MLKKVLIIIAFVTLLFTVFILKNSRGNIHNVQISDGNPSKIYSNAEIESAFQTIKDYFHSEFGGCTLTELYYPGDTYLDEYKDWDSAEVIVILSSFDVNSFAGDGFNPNSTYSDWSWVLIRNESGDWEHFDHGY
ncbi:hypothetical protein M2454_000062 [Aequitasia blattaphilus]|uniref:Lipoprotein n=1 Tax=Aequitasia blattaphilus TaxID=2949332 RepID=A0ABT1E5K0_9FIRM|nr:hypothetical protein [Aequitasia blattaphilus]MCP1100854.1 hypothetical protein [Aequitasia blattaphilus]MCR8613494.1 hypothetical protein [Aequitasia blattaphilus]